MIPLNEMIIGKVYYVEGRNYSIAVWEGKAFIGIRCKFGSCYLSGEQHWDSDPHYGTVKPIKVIGEVPAGVELKCSEPYEKNGQTYSKCYAPLYTVLETYIRTYKYEE
jgi:hypothetical protein